MKQLLDDIKFLWRMWKYLRRRDYSLKSYRLPSGHQWVRMANETLYWDNSKSPSDDGVPSFGWFEVIDERPSN